MRLAAKDWILEVNGGGIVLGDFDGDSLVDLVVVDGSTLRRVARGSRFPPRLFLGRGDCTFVPAGESWKMSGGRWGMGGAAGDVDGDGWLDLVVTQWGRTCLFRNDAGKGFLESGETSGLTGERWGTSAAFLDYDRDGALDLVVANYLAFTPGEIAERGSNGCTWKGMPVMCGPEGLVPLHDQLYRGHGDGTFEDVSLAAGFRPPVAAFGLGVMTLDHDLDGDTDVFVANDSTPNHLWENQGDGTFREVGWRAGVALDANGREQASMGIACGDWNRDGRGDLYVTDFSGEASAFYVSSASGRYRERSSQTRLFGPSLARLGWGTGMGDFDLDGDLDLYVLNGHVYPEADRPGTDTSYAEPDQLFVNDGKGGFVEQRLHDGKDVVSRAGAAADLDRDGDLDIVALVIEGPVRVLENRARQRGGGHYLCVELHARQESPGARRAHHSHHEPRDGDGGDRTAGATRRPSPLSRTSGWGAERVSLLRVDWPSGVHTELSTSPSIAVCNWTSRSRPGFRGSR